jgi:glycosyltransferase involved in cell wall biosynthesis
MIKILFAIDGLRSGGKERRMLSLVKHLSLSKDFDIELIVFNEEVHYKEVYNLDIKLNFLIRKKSKDLKVFKQFYLITKNFKPDIIHSWDTLSTLYAIPSAKLLHTKLITSKITDAPINYKKISQYGIASELCFKFSDLTLSNSNAGINAYRVSKTRSKVIYNGFDFDRLKELEHDNVVRLNYGIGEEYLVGMAASFTRNKDFRTFLEAATIIRKEHKHIGFICIGDGILRNDIENEFSGKGIYFTGRVNDVESLMNICDIGVLMTNKNLHGEGISNSLLEFMSLGKAVIASDNGGNAELIENGISGTILVENNAKKLKELIEDHSSNSDYYKRIGSIARQRIENVFSIEKMVSNFIQTYKSIMQ